MYHHLTGTIFEKKPGSLVLEVAGVGYQLQITLTTYEDLPSQGKQTFVFVFQAVRENEMSLYGFSSREEKSLFLNLIKVSGVGPAMALQILGQAPLSQIVQAVVSSDIAFLSQLKGIGKKTAGRIVVELKDRLSSIHSVKESTAKMPSNYPDDAYLALLALGMQPEQARQKLDWVSRQDEKPAKTDEWIRKALKHVG